MAAARMTPVPVPAGSAQLMGELAREIRAAERIPSRALRQADSRAGPVAERTGRQPGTKANPQAPKY